MPVVINLTAVTFPIGLTEKGILRIVRKVVTMSIQHQTQLSTFAIALLACAVTSVLAGEPRFHASQDEGDVLVSAMLETEVASPCTDDLDGDHGSSNKSYGYRNQCSCDGGLDYVLVGRSGSGYSSTPGESLWGGTYGVDAIVALTEQWSFLGTVNASHFSGGSQVAGSIGLYKIYDLDCCDRWSLSLIWDQFTDSRVDGLYLTQARLQIGYSLTDCLQVGAVYTNPTNTDNDVPYTFTFAGTNFTEIGSASISESLLGYVSAQLPRGIQCAVVAGFREDPDQMTVATSLRVPLSDRLSAYASGGYADRFATWGASLGLQILLGPSSADCGGYGPTDTCATQNSPVSMVQPAVFVPGEPEGSPPDTVLPFDELQNGSDLGQQLIEPLGQTLARRVANSNDKPVHDLISQPWWLWNATAGITDRNLFFTIPVNNANFRVRFFDTNRQFGP